MHSARLTAALLAAAALTACSSESITAPTRRATDASFSKSTCRAGYIAISGRCSGESTGTSTTTTTTDGSTCRAGYIAISGRCE